MLARYYVYEQHMKEGTRSARKPRRDRGIRKLRRFEREWTGNCNTMSVGKLTGWWPYIPGSGQHEEHGMKSQNKRGFHS